MPARFTFVPGHGLVSLIGEFNKPLTIRSYDFSPDLFVATAPVGSESRGSGGMRILSLGVALFVFWLLLSGHYKPFLIVLGLASCAAILALSRRMTIVDEEGHPVQLALGALTYWPWLIAEIVKSTWGVAKLILNPDLPISPTLVRVPADQKTRVGVNVYANSITLTPGTISVDVQGNQILVHAITAEGAEELLEGAMSARVKALEGSA